MKKIFIVFVVLIMVFVFSGCSEKLSIKKPITESNTTEGQTETITEQPTTEKPVATDKLKFFTQEIDANLLMTKDEIKNIKVNTTISDAISFDTWKEHERYFFTEESSESTTPLRNGAVLKIKVTDIDYYLEHYRKNVMDANVGAFMKIEVQEVFKTYNGCKIQKGDKLTIKNPFGYSPQGWRTKFFEEYGATIREEKDENGYPIFVADGIEYGYYQLFLKKGYDYKYEFYGENAPILEEGEYLVSIMLEHDGYYYPCITSPWSTPDLKSLDIYKYFITQGSGDSLISDFYNTFAKE